MAETWTLLSAFLLLAAVWLVVKGGSPGLAQAPTPAATQIVPAVSTSQPITNTVAPVSNIAQSTTGPLVGASDDDAFGISAGVMAGAAAAVAVLFAGIAFRLARGRTGPG